jgi:hypothetical protein
LSFRGELSREDFPNGTGEFMSMCELPRAASPKTASVVEGSILIWLRVVVPDEVFSLYKLLKECNLAVDVYVLDDRVV